MIKFIVTDPPYSQVSVEDDEIDLPKEYTHYPISLNIGSYPVHTCRGIFIQYTATYGCVKKNK